MTKQILNTRDIVLGPEKTELITMMFSKSSRLYADDERAREVITKLLMDIGILNIAKKGDWDIEDFMFEVPTLIYSPYINDVKSQSSSAFREIISSKFFNISGYDSTMQMNSIYPPLENNIKRLIFNGIVVGDFYPNRNALIIYFNIFPKIIRLSLAKSVGEFLSTLLNENGISIEQNNVDFAKMNNERNIIQFSNRINDNIVKLKGKITTSFNSIKTKDNDIVRLYSEINNENIQIEALEKFKVNFKEKFEKELEELKKMTFIKSVTLNGDGILLDVGNLSLGKGDSEVYIGYMSILIKSKEIKIYNKHSKKYLQHPHVSGNSPCFGTFSNGINKLQGVFDLKRLAVSLYQFLHTYNGRGCFGDGTINYWKTFRTKEKKFDSKGGLLKNGTIKSVDKSNTTSKT